MSNALFVYGTLMQDTNSAMARFLHQRATSLGTAYITGRLYDLGSYPGAVYDEKETKFITGQVYELEEPKAVFPILDRYEGVSQSPMVAEEYIRKLVPAQLNNKIIYYWIYLYNLDTSQLPIIASGNYLEYFQQKSDHREFIAKGR